MHYCGWQAEVTVIGFQPQGMIGLDRIDAGVLQFIGLQLRGETDPAALLIFLDHQAAAFLGHRLHGHRELVTAIATQRSQHLAGEHCEWMRSNGGSPSVRSPSVIASAASTGRPSIETSRSNPIALNIPHLVGIRAGALRQSEPVGSVCAISVAFVLNLGQGLQDFSCEAFKRLDMGKPNHAGRFWLGSPVSAVPQQLRDPAMPASKQQALAPDIGIIAPAEKGSYPYPGQSRMPDECPPRRPRASVPGIRRGTE
jgi:hypothetical protein